MFLHSKIAFSLYIGVPNKNYCIIKYRSKEIVKAILSSANLVLGSYKISFP